MIDFILRLYQILMDKKDFTLNFNPFYFKLVPFGCKTIIKRLDKNYL